MHDRGLRDVRRKLVRLMRADPPHPRALAPMLTAGDPHFDKWMAARLSPEEVLTIYRLELEYGERALAEWMAEAAFEAGLRSTTAH